MKYRIIESENNPGKFYIENKHWLYGWERVQNPISMTQENAHLYPCFGNHEQKWIDILFDSVDEAEAHIREWHTKSKRLDIVTSSVKIVKEISI